jgi:CelD/BcsL family acetyltransferase involved in cellulose biosynthesis
MGQTLSLSRTIGSEGPPDVSSTVHVEWLPLDKIDTGEWAALARRAIEPNVFLDPAFARAAAVPFGAGVGALVAHSERGLVGLLPGRVEGIHAFRPVPTFVAWVHPFAPLCTPLVDRETAPAVIPALMAALPALEGAPRLALFPLLAEDGPVARLIAAQLARGGQAPARVAPHRRAALMPGAAEAGPSGGRSKEWRRQRRRLAELGTLARETVIGTEGVAEALADFLELEARGWKGRARSAVLFDPATLRFVQRAIAALAAEGRSRIDLLRLDGRAIAAAITLFSGDRAWFWKTAYDEGLAPFSPGVQLALELTEALAGEGRIALVDSCAVAGHPMIDRVWEGRLAVADWLIPLGSEAAFKAGGAAERARHALVATLRALRDSLNG